MIKKKLLSIIALCALSATTALGAIAGTAAWFNDKITIEEGENLKGNSLGAYFAYGDGSGPTGQNPYGITKPRHLYNLAWLQYLGKYFKDGNNYPQYYFKLDADLDMKDYVLPPIGTTQNPFIGFFDGNNHTISNLTVSNNIADYANKEKPSVVGNAINNCQIIGFFGVIGDIDGAAYSISGNVAPYAKNFILDNTTVKTTSAQSLIGIGAGYVNGVLSGVGVGKSQLSIGANVSYLNNAWTQNVSEYSLVGYCTPTYRSTTKVVDITAMDPTVKSGAVSGGNEFGASLPMSTMYSDILSIKQGISSSNNNAKYLSQIDYYYNDDGTENKVETSYSKTTVEGGLYNGSEFVWKTTQTTNNGNAIAQYTFLDRGSSLDSFMYLAGNNTTTVSNGTTINEYVHPVLYTYKRFYYEDGSNVKHYLNQSIGNIVDYTGASSGATEWLPVNNTIIAMVGESTKYLGHSGETLVLLDQENSSTTWTYNSTYGVYENTINDATYFLTYQNSNNTWIAKIPDTELVDTGYYTISDTTKTHFLGVNKNSLDRETSSQPDTNEANAPTFRINSNYVYTTINGENYYLTNYRSNSSTLSYETTTSYYPLTYSHTGGSDYLKYGSYYLAYDGSKWITRNSSYAVSLNSIQETRFDESSFNPIAAENGTEVRDQNTWVQSSTQRENAVAETGNTYIPLNVQSSGSISPVNTGYLVSGSNYTSQPADIRVSKYASSNLGMSLNKNYKLTISITTTSGTTTYYLYSSNNSSLKAGGSSYGVYWHLDKDYHLYYLNGSTKYYLCYPNNGTTPSVSSSSNNKATFSGGKIIFTRNSTVYSLGYNGSNPVFANSGDASKYNASFTFDSVNFSTEGITNSFEILSRTSQTDGYVRIKDAYNGKNGTTNTNVAESIAALGEPLTVRELGFQDYDDARVSFENMLTNGGSNTYGLHFMDAQINIGRKTKLNYALVNGKEYRYSDEISNSESHYSSYTHAVQYNPETGEALKETNGDLKVVRTKDETDPGGQYELPQDCIDFNLAAYGNIKFFAGTYFTGNKTFFSLHKIFRENTSGNTLAITDIKEIRKIFNNTSYVPPEDGVESICPKYVYQYRDTNGNLSYSYSNDQVIGTDSQGNPIKVTYDSSDPVFDMAWVTDIGDNIIPYACYYFEIPLNEGEYALGSVEGATGAYLMYLDIGAADNSANVTNVIENVITTTNTYLHPAGIEFVVPSSLTGDDKCADIDGQKVGTVSVGTSQSVQTVNYTTSDNAVSYTGAASSGSTYVGDGASITNGNQEVTATPSNAVSEKKESTIKYTYDRSLGKLYADETGYKTTTTNGVAGARTAYSEPRVKSDMTPNTYDDEFKFVLRTGTAETVFVELQWYEVGWCEVEYSYQFRYSKTNDNYYYKFTFDADTAEGSTKEFTQNLEVHRLQLLSGQDVVVYGVNANKTEYEVKTPTNNTYAILPGKISQEENQEQSGS